MVNKTIFFIILLVVALRENFVTCQIDGLVSEVVKIADKYVVAPFQGLALQRLSGNIFGSGRATRSTDVVVNNASDKNFRVVSNTCDHGGYSAGLFPELEIKAQASSVYGVESHGLATGVTCTTRYESLNGGSFVELTTNNPYIGSNSAFASSSEDLTVFVTTGNGDSNQVRFIIQNKN